MIISIIVVSMRTARGSLPPVTSASRSGTFPADVNYLRSPKARPRMLSPDGKRLAAGMKIWDVSSLETAEAGREAVASSSPRPPPKSTC